MTSLSNSGELIVENERHSSQVRLIISDETLSDIVAIALRLDGVPVEDEPSDNHGLLIIDINGLSELDKSSRSNELNNRTLILIESEDDIPDGFEYLLIPRQANDYDLDPELLVKKVRVMLSGRRPSAEKNPVTGLPSAAAFESELWERINTGERFGVIFADLNQFKNYNRAYSYSRGDQMLVAVGNVMLDALDANPCPQNFLAHLGSDDFALITSEKLAPVIAERIVDSFDELVAGFYDISDLTRGTIIVTNRKGIEIESPIVTIALAVIQSSRRGLTHAAEAMEIADELLAYLKKRDVIESCCIVERKTGR